MNRIEAKIIIMVTNRLAAAKDSDAKTEMIEELSENLYQRYQELVAGGMAEDAALKQALDSLGDVEELLAFLKDAEEEAAFGQTREAQTEERMNDAAQEEHAWESSADRQDERTSSFFKEDLENGIEEIVNAALSATKVAVDCARDMAKDVSNQWKEKYPDGVFLQRGKKAECMAIPAENVESLEIRLTNGDINLGRTDEPDVLIDITGDTEDVKTMLKENGVLSISQGNTASAAFMFMRGMRHTNVELRLPEKVWENVNVSTVNGDIEIEDELICRGIHISTNSGDLNMERISSENMEFRLCSGDISGDDLNGNLHAESKSGDVEISGCLGRCELFSASGDVKFEGESREVNCSSTSGDVALELKTLPEKVKANSISGDCEIIVPTEKGFRLSYRAVSGRFSTDLPMAGRMEEKRGDVVYGEDVGGEISVTSVSGDISVRAKG